MNLKALVTTLVLGSSSMASADSISLSGSVTVSLGGTSHAAAPAYRPAPSVPVRPVVVAQDDCNTAPVYQPAPVVHPLPIYQPAPVWQAPYYRITNTTVSSSGSVYHGAIGTSKILKAPRALPTKRNYSGNAFLMVKPKPTQAWFDLTEATRIDSNREFFTIGAAKGVFNTLQLQALGNGNSRIAQVLVEYADNGKSQVFKLNNKLINRSNATITLDLDGEYRSIKRIVVYGATDQGSAFKLLAK